MDSHRTTQSEDVDPKWATRQRYWRRKLRRLRLDAEPVEEQLAKYKRVTWVLTALPAGLSLFFLALFTAFHRPDVGLVLAAILFAPVVAIAWLDYLLLSSRVARYTRERDEHRL